MMVQIKILIISCLLVLHGPCDNGANVDCFKAISDYLIENDFEIRLNEKEELVIILNYSESKSKIKAAVVTKSLYRSLLGVEDNYPSGFKKNDGIDFLLYGDIPANLQYEKKFGEIEYLKQKKKSSNLPQIPVEPTIYTFSSKECKLLYSKINDDVFNFNYSSKE